MTVLAQMHCTPVRKNDPPLSEDAIREYGCEIPEWRLSTQDGLRYLEREFRFRGFSAALAFTDQVGELAEAEDHHPALLTEWGRVTVRWWTHRIGGLNRNDFIMAAKTDELFATAGLPGGWTGNQKTAL